MSNMNCNFKGRNALITGGSSGIGFKIAESLLTNQVDNVVIIGSNLSKLENAKEKLSNLKLGRVYSINVDLSDISESLIQIDDFLSNLSFEVDILVNNAGVMCSELFPNISMDEYDRVMDINLKASFFLSQYFAKRMIKNQTKGNILMIASSSSNRPAINPYMLSKWAIKGLTTGLAKALIPYNIVVNGIAPGPTATPMLSKSENDDLFNSKNPAKRYCTTTEVSNLATYLLSDNGKMMIGEVISISGGAGVITFDDQTYKLPEF